ncbi:helix-turn-helix domain-containing protein [Vallitalea okinawensis]|uniref:helix-turn-helix domain-containing protein n=1 Tax=Vallitalea okinawensis TaxID=2078660 RepID=UPI001300673F|nr:helix-turn-helix domain-containing protein [Vallitalea okinawensis]
MGGSILHKLFFGFVLFLIIPVVVLTSFFNFGMMRFFSEELSNADATSLYLLQNNSDDIMNEVKNTFVLIASHDKVVDMFKNDHQIRSYEYVYSCSEIMDLLYELSSYNNNIHSIYLYNANTDHIISSSDGFDERSDFYYTDWINLYEENKYTMQMTASRKSVDDGYLKEKNMPWKVTTDYNSQIVTFIYPFDIYPNKQLKGAVAINIYDENLIPTNNLEGDENNFIIINKNGKMITQKNKESLEVLQAFEEENQEQLQESHGYFTKNIMGERYILSYAFSSDHNLIFIKYTAIQELLKSTYQFRYLVIILGLVITSFGLLLSYIVTKRFYQPIKNTLAVLKTDIHKSESKNELRIINDMIHSIIKEKNQLSQLFESNKKDMMQKEVQDILRGYKPISPSLLVDDYGSYVALIISIDHYKNLSKTYSTNERYLYKELVRRTSEKVIDTHYPCRGTLLENDKVGIIISVPKNYGYGELKRLIEHIHQQLSIIKQFTTSVAVGNIHENVNASYLEALEALNYRITYGVNCNLFYHELQKDEFEYYAFGKDNLLINYLKDNDEVKINELLLESYYDIKDSQSIGYDNILQVYFTIIGHTVEFLTQMGVSLPKVFGDNFDINRKILEQETLEDIHQVLRHFYASIITYMQNTFNDSNTHKVIQVIQDNFINSNFDIQHLEEKTGLSYSHIRRIVKENTGMTYVYYINMLRIEEVKNYLETSDLSIREIAEKVGYNNHQSLSRFFKKFEGITPGEYRKKAKSSSE